MKFREMVRRVQLQSGFSDKESQEALEQMVEALAVRLSEGERKDFASQLPQKLKDMALSVYPTAENATKDLVTQFMEFQKISYGHAKKQVLSAWGTLKQAISKGQIDHIKAQLPKDTVNLLH